MTKIKYLPTKIHFIIFYVIYIKIFIFRKTDTENNGTVHAD